MSRASNSGADEGLRAHPLTPEAEAAPAPVPGAEDAPALAGLVASGPGAVARVLTAVPGQYWGIDTSYDHVTFEEAVRLREAGVRVAFQCLWTGIERPAPCVNNLHNYKAAGLSTNGYLSVSRGRTGLQHVIEGYDNLPEDVRAPGFMRYVAVDVELEGLSFGTHVHSAVTQLQIRGYQPLIYTSYNAWKNYMGDPKVPDGWLLWNAFWDNDPDYDFARFPYGGGGFVLIGEQFTGGEDVEGVFADRNLFTEEYFTEVVPGPVPVPPPPLTYDNRDLTFIMHYLTVCWVQDIIPALSEQDKAILRAYVATL